MLTTTTTDLPVKPTEADFLASYRDRVNSALEWRKNENYDSLWHRLIDLYAGEHYSRDSHYGLRPQVNLCWSTINIIMSSTLVRYPKITVSPLDGQSVLAAAKNEAQLNHDWRIYNWQEAISEVAKDALIIGHGVMKIVYRLQKLEGSVEDVHRKVKVLASSGQDIGFVAPTKEQVAKQLEEQNHFLVYDRPSAERLSPFDFIVDQNAKTFNQARWFCQRQLVPTRSLRMNQAYIAEARAKVPSTDGYQDPGDQQRRHGQYSWVYEFYDLDEGTVSLFGEAAGFLRKPDSIPFNFGHPFVVLENQRVPEKLYPIGELEMIESLQLELNDARRRMAEDRDRYRLKYTVAEELLVDPRVREALLSDQPGAVIPMIENHLGMNAIRVLEAPGVQPDLYNTTAMSKQDIAEVSGVTEYQRGGASLAGTATEAAILNDASQTRVAQKLAEVERFMRRVAERVAMLYSQYQSTPRQIPIPGAARNLPLDQGDLGIPGASIEVSGNDAFVTTTREELLGSFQFSIEAGSTQPVNDTLKRQTAQQLIAIAAPFLGTVIDPRKFLSYVLKEGYQIQDPSQFFAPEQMPEADPSGVSVGSAPGGAGQIGGTQGPLDRPAPQQAIRQ